MSKKTNYKVILFICVFNIVFSCLHFFSFFSESTRELGAYKGGDGEQYVESAESLINGGDFIFFKTNEALFKSNFSEGTFDEGIYYAFRTPGYAMCYIPIR